MGVRFILLEELVLMFLDRVFPGFKVTSCGLFRLIRDTEGAQLFMAHDPELFKAAKHAPDFYD